MTCNATRRGLFSFVVYRSRSQFFEDRVGAAMFSIWPASILSGFIGTSAVSLGAWLSHTQADGYGIRSLGDLMLALAGSGLLIAIGTIASTLIVAFYLFLFGLPVAFALGDRIRNPIGLAVSLLAALAASVVAASWLWGSHALSFGSSPMTWEAIFAVGVFAVPASYCYRRSVIMALDEIA